MSGDAAPPAGGGSGTEAREKQVHPHTPGKKATIITTNLPFTRWEEVLKDKVLCSALVDRLCHKSYLVNMTGTSYRVKETKKIIEKI